MSEIRSILTGQPLATPAPAEAAPGTFVAVAAAPTDVPRYGIVRLMRQPDGTYIPILKAYGQHRKIPGLAEELGLSGLSQRTLERLVQTGFVACLRPTPQVTLVDIGSLMTHLEGTRDPEFWTAERLAQYGKGWKS